MLTKEFDPKVTRVRKKVVKWVAKLGCGHEAGEISVAPEIFGLHPCGHVDCQGNMRVVVDVVTSTPLRGETGILW